MPLHDFGPLGMRLAYQSDDDGRFMLIAGGSIRDIRLDIDDERVAKQRSLSRSVQAFINTPANPQATVKILLLPTP